MKELSEPRRERFGWTKLESVAEGRDERERWRRIHSVGGPGSTGGSGDSRDPESPLRWTCKSVRRLAEELQQEGMPSVIRRWRTAACAGLQPAGQPEDPGGSQHAIGISSLNTSTQGQRYLKQGAGDFGGHQEEGVGGDFKECRAGVERKGKPEEVRVHDFEIREPDKGKVAPYGSMTWDETSDG